MIDLPVITDPGDVLAQPTRARLFGLLSELKRSVGTAELAERLGLHPNGVRLHLERLAEEGLVERARVRTPRGRPPDAWRIARDARPAGAKPRAYEDLGRWLAQALGAPGRGLRGIEDTGRRIGHELAPGEAGGTDEALETTLIALGFQPTLQRGDDGGLTCCLGNCPYSAAVRENQPAVCALHKGITRGLLDVLDPNARLTAFVPRDPDEAGCVIEIQA
ncbi:MAG: helix-turn-helix transcriptional regulator [Solirubrobacteraceae bacterium]